MKNKTPLVTVVIPCWNQARYLGDCIGSLQAQTWDHWEAIVVNDGSPDDTEATTERLMDKESRVRYIKKANGGLSSARNAGLDVARGDFVQFLDADDVLLETKLGRQLDRFSDAPDIDVVYCDYLRSHGRNLVENALPGNASTEMQWNRPILDFAIRWEHEFSIPIHAALFRRRFFSDLQLRFDESLPNHEDWDLWMGVSAHTSAFCRVPEPLVIYRQAEDCMSGQRDSMYLGFASALDKHLARCGSDRELCDALARKLLHTRYRYGRTLAGRIRTYLDAPSWTKRHLPWPVQRLLLALTEPPSLPQPVTRPRI